MSHPLNDQWMEEFQELMEANGAWDDFERRGWLVGDYMEEMTTPHDAVKKALADLEWQAEDDNIESGMERLREQAEFARDSLREDGKSWTTKK